ncbi:MAG TPA: hypothetical protein VNM48_20520 [Chloroflexota bacterium]|nr:hypothetical protein [Chloroflexota bacterium]
MTTLTQPRKAQEPITYGEAQALPYQDKLALLHRITIKSGSHDAPAPDQPLEECALCVQEWYAFLAGIEHTDAPEHEPDADVSPVIARIARRLNDAIYDDELRTRLLVPLLPLQKGTAGSRQLEERRGWRALDWLVRENLPAWCDLVPALSEAGQALRALGPVTDRTSLTEALKQTRVAREAAWPLRQASLKRVRSAAAVAAAVAGGTWEKRYRAAYAAARKALAPISAPRHEAAAALVRELCAMRDEAGK